MKKTWTIILSILLLTFSCKVESIDPSTVELGYEYFPLEIGKSWTYKIHQEKFTLLNKIDTVFYQKEEIVDTVRDGDELSYHLHIFRKANLTDTWTLDSVWSQKITTKYAIRVENNKRFLKLVFPLEKEQKWDENLLNISNENIGELLFVNESVQVNDTLLYENALKVQYEEEESFISSKQHFECYQKNIGLTYIYQKNIQSQPNEPEIGEIWEQVLIGNN